VVQWRYWGDTHPSDATGVLRRRQQKRSSLSEVMTKKVVRFLEEKWGDTHQLLPRVTPTLVTPLYDDIASQGVNDAATDGRTDRQPYERADMMLSAY